MGCAEQTRGAAPVTRADFFFNARQHFSYNKPVTIEMFKKEIGEATKAYDKFVVCLEKSSEDFEAALVSLVKKAIKAYEKRGPNLRHGIALDRQVTVILSQSDGPRPLCGIYFNLSSPYKKDNLPPTVQPLIEPIGEGPQKSED